MAQAAAPSGRRHVESVTISASGTVSAPVDARGKALVAIHLPAAFTGVAITFQASTKQDGTYQDVYDGAGNQVSLTVAQGQCICPVGDDAVALASLGWFKLVSGSAEGAQRTIEVELTD